MLLIFFEVLNDFKRLLSTYFSKSFQIHPFSIDGAVWISLLCQAIWRTVFDGDGQPREKKIASTWFMFCLRSYRCRWPSIFKLFSNNIGTIDRFWFFNISCSYRSPSILPCRNLSNTICLEISTPFLQFTNIQMKIRSMQSKKRRFDFASKHMSIWLIYRPSAISIGKFIWLVPQPI